MVHSLFISSHTSLIINLAFFRFSVVTYQFISPRQYNVARVPAGNAHWTNPAPVLIPPPGIKKEARELSFLGLPVGGGYLLSRFRSTIGSPGLNFSVRNGKRWIPRDVPALMSCFIRRTPPRGAVS